MTFDKNMQQQTESRKEQIGPDGNGLIGAGDRQAQENGKESAGKPLGDQGTPSIGGRLKVRLPRRKVDAKDRRIARLETAIRDLVEEVRKLKAEIKKENGPKKEETRAKQETKPAAPEKPTEATVLKEEIKERETAAKNSSHKKQPRVRKLTPEMEDEMWNSQDFRFETAKAKLLKIEGIPNMQVTALKEMITKRTGMAKRAIGALTYRGKDNSWLLLASEKEIKEQGIGPVGKIRWLKEVEVESHRDTLERMCATNAGKLREVNRPAHIALGIIQRSIQEGGIKPAWERVIMTGQVYADFEPMTSEVDLGDPGEDQQDGRAGQKP